MKQLIWGLGFIIILVIGVLAYMLTSDITTVTNQEQEGTTVEEKAKVEQEKVEVASSNVEEAEDLNPFGTSIKMEELDDKHYQNYIHGMSHQKVIAEEKWGFYEITEERIHWLLEGLEVTQPDNEDVYKDILERWASGDFSIVDQDHNTVWRMQNGNVGRATGILSPEDEKAYIEENK